MTPAQIAGPHERCGHCSIPCGPEAPRCNACGTPICMVCLVTYHVPYAGHDRFVTQHIGCAAPAERTRALGAPLAASLHR